MFIILYAFYGSCNYSPSSARVFGHERDGTNTCKVMFLFRPFELILSCVSQRVQGAEIDCLKQGHLFFSIVFQPINSKGQKLR